MFKFIKKYFNIPENFYNKKNIPLILATLGGFGYSKKAPGTVGSFVTLLIMLPIGYISHTLFIILATLSIIIGFYVSEKAYSEEDPDPSHVVIDEFAGMAISLILVQNNLFLGIIAFILFRILDIKKPWIIGMAEKFFPRGSGIMMDDIIAGFITMIIVTALSIAIN